MFILLSSFKITLKLELKKGIYLFNCLKKKKNLVVGAGFSGAVIAERLANIMDEDVLVIDKNSFLGGESFDYKDKSGIMVHKFGSNIFHTNYEYIMKYVGSEQGNLGEYDRADKYGGIIVRECLRTRRLHSISFVLYDRWWNYLERKRSSIPADNKDRFPDL